MHIKGSHVLKLKINVLIKSQLTHEVKVLEIALPSEKNEMLDTLMFLTLVVVFTDESD